MSLSNELVSQFVKTVNTEEKTKTKTNLQGKVVYSNNALCVLLDGSDTPTPVTSSVSVKEGHRVTVVIENHSASITENLTDPSASSKTVESQGAAINEFDALIADKVSTEQLDAQIARIDTLVTDNVTVREELDANTANIEQLVSKDVEIEESLSATNANIKTLQTEKLDVAVAVADYATIENLNSTNQTVNNLEATYADFEVATSNRLDVAEADIDKLKTDKLDVTSAEVTYANIDFANITDAAVEKIFSDTGIIKNLVVSDGQITGELVGVTIKGDLIDAGTLKTDRLIVLGSDGNYYKINTDFDAEAMSGIEPVEEDQIHGSTLVANSITAEKIAVDDLVAFGATIGGFNITESALYSDVKAGPLNTTRGIYLDDSGQFSVGDSEQYLRYFKDTTDNYKLEISASSTMLTSTDESVEEALATLKEDVTHAQNSADSAQQTADDAESLIKQLSDSVSTLVTDGNGTSLMVQTDDGWTFSTSDLQTTVNAVSEGLDALVTEIGSTNSTIDILQQAVDDLGILTDYITIGTYEDEPCIELGESDSDFKLRITNTRILFMEGSDMPAYFTNQSMHIKKAVIEEELQQGGFVWKVRTNGNMGLVWKGVSS